MPPFYILFFFNLKVYQYVNRVKDVNAIFNLIVSSEIEKIKIWNNLDILDTPDISQYQKCLCSVRSVKCVKSVNDKKGGTRGTPIFNYFSFSLLCFLFSSILIFKKRVWIYFVNQLFYKIK